MLASVVIPTYNQRPDYLWEAVVSALGQTVPVEVIVVDDCSLDPVVVPSGARVIRHQENRGISAALNTGIAAMSTAWFCWLSSDDLLHPAKVQLQRDACEKAGRRASFHMYYSTGGCNEVSLFPAKMEQSHKRQKQQLGTGCVINGSTVMLHRSVFEKVGTFDESYRFSQDWDFWCRVTQAFEWLPMRGFLGTRRTGGNLTERINQDEGLRAIRDAEDERIRKTYGR